MSDQTPFASRSTPAHTGRILQTAFSVAILLATLFTAFSPKMFSGGFGAILGLASTPQPGDIQAVPTSQQQKIGIVSGHWNDNGDPGAVCQDGVVTEQAVNLDVASRVRQGLEAFGYQVDLLQEYDPRLDGYKAALLLSIHADTCDYIDDQATGFKTAASTYSRDRNLANRLTACLYDKYAGATGLPYRPWNVTTDMTDYHAFQVINPATPAAIIETGFLYLDRDLLVNHPQTVADGIVQGVICFMTGESVQPTPNP